MSPKKDVWTVSSGLGVKVVGILLTGAIGLNTWAVAAMYDRPTVDEVKELIVDKSPYVPDRAMILQALEDVRRTNVELKNVIQRHTQAITELKVLLRTD